MIRYALIVTLLLALAGLFFTLQKANDVSIAPTAEVTKLPRYTLTNAVLTRFDATGTPSLRGHADTLDYFDDESAHAEKLQLTVLSGVTMPWHIAAPSGTLQAHSHIFLLEGDVVADGNWPDNNEALTVRTEQLWVDPDQHLLHTDRAVTLTSATREGSATGFRGDWIEKNMQLLDDVKMHYEAQR